MAGFVPDDGHGFSTSVSDGVISTAFGKPEDHSAALQGAQEFKAAAQAGQFRVDPEAAKIAIKELERAEDAMRDATHAANQVARRPPIGGSPYAQFIADKYLEGGESAKRAVLADIEFYRLLRETIEIAMRNYERIDADNADSLRGL